MIFKMLKWLHIISSNTFDFNLFIFFSECWQLRVFRLARMWETMNKLLSIIWKSISAVGYLTFVLFLILYIFAVIGEWF